MRREPWRGPHQDQEYWFMIRRGKPAAALSQLEWDRNRLNWEALMCEGLIDVVMVRLGGYEGNDREYLVTRAGDQQRMNRLVEEFTRVGRDHFRLGLLLGYHIDHVRKFCNYVGGRYSRSYQKKAA
jgi:hypothetical protein